MTIIDCFKIKMVQIDGLTNVKRPQKELKKRAFIKNTLSVLEYLSRYERLDSDNQLRFHYIPQYKWQDIIKNNATRREVFDFLKHNNIIEVKTKNGTEYYLPQTIAYQNLPQCKAYRITKEGRDLILNSSAKSVDDLFKIYDIPQCRMKYTPADVLQKYSDEDYFLPETKQNIISVLNNNMQLEFHALPADEMVEKYKSEVKCSLTDEMIKDKLQMVQDYFISKDFTYNIRMYSAFTNCPKSWRDCITDAENKPIGELFDVHSSVFNLLPLVCRIKILESHGDMTGFDQEEQFLESVLKKDIYTSIGNGLKSREQIKSKVMEVIFSNNEKFAGFAKTSGGKIKNCSSNNIKTWMKNNIPIMYRTLATFEQERNSKFDEAYQKYLVYLQKKNSGIKTYHVVKPQEYKSTFWILFQKMETELMANLNAMVSQRFGVKIYNIHDGLYAPKTICTPINRQIVMGMYNEIKHQLINEINKKYGYNIDNVVVCEEKTSLRDYFKGALQKVYKRRGGNKSQVQIFK